MSTTELDHLVVRGGTVAGGTRYPLRPFAALQADEDVCLRQAGRLRFEADPFEFGANLGLRQDLLDLVMDPTIASHASGRSC